ncbi:hypothetical protein [Gillisia sp. CAL575]|uniref:hypothetical protein n=1 Tax=Gillisia sp. CAL575 TaxID=985255 RepID=UPI00054F246A|nr:hypothetical protein [Gillisia sp. CAL575]
MKIVLAFIILFYTSSFLGQDIYYSPMTENLESGEKSIINRTITIEQETILIKTETNFGYDLQTLKILSKELKQTIPPIMIYNCSSPDGVYPTILFIPQRKVTTEILIIQPSFTDDSDDHFRFYIDAEEKPFQQ